VLFSAASLWEIAINAGFGRRDFTFDPAEIAQAALDAGFTELVVRSNAAALVAGCPCCTAIFSTVFWSHMRSSSPQLSTPPIRNWSLIRTW
jgi:hypothetical protein